MSTTNIIDNFNIKVNNIKDISSKELQLIREIRDELKKLQKEGNLELINNKIIFNYKFIQILSKKKNFKNDSTVANTITKKLKKAKAISSRSILYPKNIKFSSTNPLSKAYLGADLKKVDLVSEIYEKFLLDEKIETDLKLYIYLRLFYIKKLSQDDIKLIDEKSFFHLGEDSILVLVKNINEKKEYRPIKILFADDNIRNFYFKCLSKGDILFKRTINDYEKEISSFLSKYELNIAQIRTSIEFLYQVKNTPFKLSMQKLYGYPKITLQEINYLFPNVISQDLINIDKQNEAIYFNTYKNKHLNEEEDIDDDINETINEYIKKDFSRYDELKEILKVPNNIKRIDKYFDKCYRFLETSNSSDSVINPIEKFIKFLLQKADRRNTEFNNIKLVTMKGYMSVAFRYIFNVFIIEGEISEKSVSVVTSQIVNNEKLTKKSIVKYKRIANLFLRNYTEFDTIAKINLAQNVTRNIVFKDEFEVFLNSLNKEDEQIYKVASNKSIKIQMRSVYSILLYYSGLRKTELRTRLLEDISIINGSTFIIDINSNGFRETMKSTDEIELSLKSVNSKRRIKFEIINANHLSILTKYILWLEKNRFKFLFPRINQKSGNLLKKHVISDSFLNGLSKTLQQITNRYTPLHSLRHTFASRYLLENIDNVNSKFVIYELSNIMGHSDPLVTIDNYLHLDFLNFKHKISSINEKVHINS